MSDELNFGAPNGTPATTASGEDDSSQRREKLLALLRGRLHWAILLSLILGGGLGYLLYNSVVPMYRSTGSVVVEGKGIFTNLDNPTDKRGWYSFVARQQQLLRSREVAERAMATDTWLSRGDEAVPWTPEEFSKAIDTEIDERNNDRNIFTISFDAPDAITAGLGNRALLEAYSTEYDIRAENEFRQEIRQLQSQIQKSEIIIETELGQRRTVITDNEFNQMDAQIRAFVNQRIELQEALDFVRAQLDSRNPIKEGMSTNPADLIATDPVLTEYQAQLQQIEDAIKVLEFEGKGPGHIQVKRLTSQRDVIKAKMEERLEQLLSEDTTVLLGDPEYDQLRLDEQLLTRQLNEIEQRLESLTTKQSDIAGIQDRIEAEMKIIEEARENISEIDVELEARKGTIDAFAPGATPSSPDNGGKAKQVAVLGAMAGTGVGFGFVMLLGLLDSRLRHAGDARMGLPNLRMLGILPTLPENFADPEQSERAAHAVHHIRTLLQISNRGTARVFSITSPAA
ncbi:MAG: hypothetical protein AAGJ38_07715, partial [Planctomycetota bacterium]